MSGIMKKIDDVLHRHKEEQHGENRLTDNKQEGLMEKMKNKIHRGGERIKKIKKKIHIESEHKEGEKKKKKKKKKRAGGGGGGEEGGEEEESESEEEEEEESEEEEDDE